jgi:hypothetical protein
MFTITEALAEIATIDKRLAKKGEGILPYVARPDQLRDPLEKRGGSEAHVRQELQSISDLLSRKIQLRAAVAEANSSTQLEIDGVRRSVADWLVWKRECYVHEKGILGGIISQVHQVRENLQRVTQEKNANPIDTVAAVDERDIAEQLDYLEDIYGRLDGLLSLKNALTTIDV